MITATAVGKLGKPAEVKALQGEQSLVTFSIAIDQGYGDRKTTLWVDCSYFTKRPSVAQYLQKGTQVAVHGEPSLRKWESNGKSGASFTMRVNEVQLLGGKPAENAESPVGGTGMAEQADDLPF
jgi:single-strand DNA-binding protein